MDRELAPDARISMLPDLGNIESHSATFFAHKRYYTKFCQACQGKNRAMTASTLWGGIAARFPHID